MMLLVNFVSTILLFLQYVFTDTTNRYIFTTTDFVRTVSGYQLEFSPHEVTFDERKPFSLLAYDKTDRLRRVIIGSCVPATLTPLTK